MTDTVTPELAVLNEIAAKLDRLIAITATAGKHEDERVDLLINLGVDSRIISAISGLTTNAIAIRKTRFKKAKKPAKQS